MGNDTAQPRQEKFHEQRQNQPSPVRDMVQEVLLEHQAPPFNLIEQGCLEGPCIQPQPALEGAEGLHSSHLLVELLVGAQLLPELLQGGRRLGEPLLGVCRCGDVEMVAQVPAVLGQEMVAQVPAVLQQEMVAQVPPVLQQEVTEAPLQPRAVLAALGGRCLSPGQQLLAPRAQRGHGLQGSLVGTGRRGEGKWRKNREGVS